MRRLRVALIGAVVAVAALAGCGSGDGGLQQTAATRNPLAGDRLYVNPAGAAVQAEQQLRARGDAAAAERIGRIAREPTATWFGGGDPFGQARQLTSDAAARGELAVLVAYDIPERDCGQYSKGGAGSAEQYLAWVGALAAGIDTRPAVVVLEPDAIAHAIVGCATASVSHDRYHLLSQAVDVLTAHPRTRVYLDAGNAGWIKDTGAVAAALRESGIGHADGFALNVANFQPTAATERYGAAVSRRLGGTHFVIDTSRNSGSPPAPSQWCNPSGVRLGQPPTTRTDAPLVDALLWVKQPGDSDGSCQPGAPPAGTWWQQYAEQLAG